MNVFKMGKVGLEHRHYYIITKEEEEDEGGNKGIYWKRDIKVWLFREICLSIHKECFVGT